VHDEALVGICSRGDEASQALIGAGDEGELVGGTVPSIVDVFLEEL
jgi:hypothetical protein